MKPSQTGGGRGQAYRSPASRGYSAAATFIPGWYWKAHKFFRTDTLDSRAKHRAILQHVADLLRGGREMDVRALLDGVHPKPVGPFRNEQAAIAFLRDRLVADLKPESIWLFGSRARGDARPDSDFDLLVVLRDGLSDEDYSHYAVARPVVACSLSCDIVPASWSTFAGEKDEKGSYVNAIVSEGREIYRARALRPRTGR